MIDFFSNHDDAVRQARLERDLATAKAEVELAGIAATRTEAAHVARLEQIAKIAAHRKTIGEAGLGTIAQGAGDWKSVG